MGAIFKFLLTILDVAEEILLAASEPASDLKVVLLSLESVAAATPPVIAPPISAVQITRA